MPAVKLVLGNEVHLEKAIGTAEQNIAYCSKEDGRVRGPYILGEPTTTNKGSKVISALHASKDIRQYAANMTTDKELALFKQAEAFYNATATPRQHQTKCIVLWGPGGTGKSTLARNLAKKMYPEEVHYSKDNTKWWPNYAGEKVVIIDEFKGCLTLTDFKRMIDTGPWTVEVKGGHRQFTSELVIICSNTPPERWYSHEVMEGNREAFQRRLEEPIGREVEVRNTYVRDSLYLQWELVYESPTEPSTPLLDLERMERRFVCDAISFTEAIATQGPDVPSSSGVLHHREMGHPRRLEFLESQANEVIVVPDSEEEVEEEEDLECSERSARTSQYQLF